MYLARLGGRARELRRRAEDGVREGGGLRVERRLLVGEQRLALQLAGQLAGQSGLYGSLPSGEVPNFRALFPLSKSSQKSILLLEVWSLFRLGLRRPRRLSPLRSRLRSGLRSREQSQPLPKKFGRL